MRYFFRFIPLFKKFLIVRKNVQNRKKLLKFKKKKWDFLKFMYNKTLKNYFKYKALDQSQYLTTKNAIQGNSYKKRYRNTMNAVKVLKLHYTYLRKTQLKNIINMISKAQIKEKKSPLNYQFIKYFESRLDVALMRSKFCVTTRYAQQIIKHGKVTVNYKVVKKKAYMLKPGDLIEIKRKFKWPLIQSLKSFALTENSWPHPPKHLIINYKTLQIIYNHIEYKNLSTTFFTNLKLEKIALNYKNN